MVDKIIDVLSSSFEKHSDHTAIAFESEVISFSLLDRRVNDLANLLRDNIPLETIVAISGARSINNTFVYLLTTFVAGKTYLPIAFGLPAHRLQNIVAQAKVKYFLPSQSSDLFENIGVLGCISPCNAMKGFLFSGVCIFLYSVTCQ
ncbi:AMP-binding protein [Algoriphagus antarcticus]|uniref:AMP-binding enzyme n=1 Tax=Algoriphagus antarcticus TaxID=238540 RepID=A0A3E0D312_9BACT|nr:AMP-binding protein [Algoriphagus antarcticus]REG76917.1 AMP-binding enzyme [Algoriphagus antarcticus]